VDITHVRLATVAAAAGFAGIALFQLALASGAPLGEAAWAGAHPGQLPAALRVASGAAVVFWSFAGLVVLSRGGVSVVALPAGLTRWGVWIIVALLAVSALMNALSSSSWERFGWAPYSLLVGLACFVLAIGTRK
jgi:hypothetical protein